MKHFSVTVFVLCASVVGGCNPEHATIAGCTNFTGHTLATAPGFPPGCDGGFFIVLSDAPAAGVDELHVTITSVELGDASGETFHVFDGRRREDLLRYRDEGFLLVLRQDLPEVVVDRVVIQVEAPAVVPAPAIPVRFAHGGRFEVLLDEPVSIFADSMGGLHLDLDVEQALAGAVAANGVLILDPPILAREMGALADHDFPLAEMTAMVVEPFGANRLRVVTDTGTGELSLVAAQPAIADTMALLRATDWIRFRGRILWDGTFEAAALTLSTSGN